MELHNQPVEHVENKFVITEDRVYFLQCKDRVEAPRFIEILGEIFDLDDTKTFEVVNGQLSGGKIILGYYDPSTKEIDIHVPLESNDYVEKRIKEVFGV